MRGVALAGCLALSGPAVLCYADTVAVRAVEDPFALSRTGPGQRLAVVVPVYRGDLSRAVSSLGRWPSTCSPLTEQNADLLLYYAEGEEDAPAVTAAVDTINETAGRCFAKTRLVYAHLSEEEDIYPKGPSVMFFNMFLDEGVRSELSEYDALAIVEWDVLVASDRSFEELYYAAFRGNEDFWVKGSNLGGTTFHSTAQESDMWNMLGHINGNAIYNNNDPTFVEYVDYTRTRWDYTYPYDVALWLTISDFPYSWPLWQRYSSNFVTTNLISYVGFEHVDNTTVSDAIAGQTLFIHGSRVEEGSLASIRATRHEKNGTYTSSRHLFNDTQTPLAVCNGACGSVDTVDLPAGTSTVCDDTCDGESARFGGFLCGAGDSERFGYMCRLCYVDIEEARREERSLALTRSDPTGEEEASHVIMCSTMRPPEVAECSDKCGRKKDTVCDESCGTGRHGDYNCNWRDHGTKCRFCFHDLETALMADNVARRRGGRVIMCSTFEPPETTERIKPDIRPMESRTRAFRARNLRKWRHNARWETVQKGKGNAGHVVLPTGQDQDSNDEDISKWQREDRSLAATWQTTEKWKNNFCDEENCPHISNNGLRGRVCDDSCKDGDPYGKNGCVARNGRYGNYCRVCYYDRDTAISNDDVDGRAIMCDTKASVSARTYAGGKDRRLTTLAKESATRIGQMLKAWKDSVFIDEGVEHNNQGKLNHRKLQNWKDNAKWRRENKWKNNDDEEVPKWRETEKWKNNFCDEDDCPHTNSNGYRGRVCDKSCSDGDPYGTNGCGARNGAYGDYCRVCYIHRDRALANDDPDDRAIMCATMMPVTAYETSSRRLSASTKEGDSHGLPLVVAEVEDAQSMFAAATVLPYTNDLVRGNLCAFIAGHLNEVDQVEVAVMSVLQFLPGMTVAVATDNKAFDAYGRAVGGLPGVTVHATEDPFTASLFADEFCGVDTSLILYMKPHSVVSRQFTSKDTHSTRGDLLVIHGNAEVSYADRELAKQTTVVLGFVSPSFTFKTDLFLPVGANADLRQVLVSGIDVGHPERDSHGCVLEAMEGFPKLRDMSAVPQVMAALAYSRNTPGVWFVDPETWVSQHLFRSASVWEIPLVKPRYTCSIDQSALQSDLEDIDLGPILQSNLDFFARGGTCASGYVDIHRAG